MLFNSLHFLFFFPIVCIIYFLIPTLKWRNLFLLCASYYFYMNWEPVYALLLLSSTFITYLAAIGIDKYKERRKRRMFLTGSLILNLGVLFLFKYYNFAAENIAILFDKLGLKKKIRIVNRLDRNTSGIVILAKNEYIQECLIKQMKTNEFKKEYLAIAKGILESKSGTLNFPIARKEGSIIERTVSSDGDSAITHYDVVKEFNNLSLVHIVLETGRTHQIRVHFSYIGHPILGDTLYGSPSELINRQALHSYKLTFIHPVTKKVVSLEAPLPNDIKNIINN